MDYKKILEGVVDIINTTKKSDIGFSNICSYIGKNCPELKESEDERIKKCVKYAIDKLFLKEKIVCDVHKEDVLTWLKKQGEQEQLYIRFGEIPTDEKSKIFQGEIEVGTENGVSVYPAFKTSEGDIVLGLNLPITKTTLYTQQHLIEYDDRPCYLVKGDYVGKDIDGQPLINNVSIIEKIDTYRAIEKKQGEQKPVADFSELRTWKYIVDAVWTEKEGIGQYLDSPFTEEVAKKLQKRFGNIEQKSADLPNGEDYCIDSLWHAKNILEKTLGKVDGYQTDDGILDHKCAISAVNKLYKQKPSAWSEEDTFKVQRICKYLVEAKKYYADIDLIRECIEWLKSLKDRYTWKPTDEQIKALDDVISSRVIKYYVLSKLWKDLKKLKGGISYESKRTIR